MCSHHFSRPGRVVGQVSFSFWEGGNCTHLQMPFLQWSLARQLHSSLMPLNLKGSNLESLGRGIKVMKVTAMPQ